MRRSPPDPGRARCRGDLARLGLADATIPPENADGAVPGRAARCRVRCGADLGSQRLRAEWWSVAGEVLVDQGDGDGAFTVGLELAEHRRSPPAGAGSVPMATRAAPLPPPCRGPRARIPPLAGQSSDLLDEPGSSRSPAHRSAAGPLPGPYPSRPGGPSPSPAETLAPAAGGRRATTQERTINGRARRCGTPSSVHASCPGAIRHTSPGLISPSLPSSWVTRRRPATT